MMNDFIGHDKCWSIFKNAYQSGRLHHGWILTGPLGIGKASFAKRMAHILLDPNKHYAALLRAGTHPDLHIISRPPKEEPKAGEGIAPGAELKRSISISQIRKLQSVMANKPSMSENRVVIIDSADDLERNGANALLKSLEEPPKGTIFFLISHASDKLLPTIKSRCQIMRFDPLSTKMMEKALELQMPEISKDEKSALIRAGNGSPGQALAYMGLELAEIESAMDEIRLNGDANNAIRTKLVKRLTLKAAQVKYEAFLRRAPSYIAAYAHTIEMANIKSVTDAYSNARELAARAIGLSLDKPSVVFEMVSLLSTLQKHKIIK